LRLLTIIPVLLCTVLLSGCTEPYEVSGRVVEIEASDTFQSAGFAADFSADRVPQIGTPLPGVEITFHLSLRKWSPTGNPEDRVVTITNKDGMFSAHGEALSRGQPMAIEARAPGYFPVFRSFWSQPKGASFLIVMVKAQTEQGNAP